MKTIIEKITNEIQKEFEFNVPTISTINDILFRGLNSVKSFNEIQLKDFYLRSTGECSIDPFIFKIDTFIDKWLINNDDTFEARVKPVMKYLAENHHPHTKIMIDSNTAELLEGQKTVVTDEFIVD